MTLAYDEAGDSSAPTVVLLHSTVCDRRMWDPQWQPLQDAGWHVVRVDFPGHGDTPAPTEEFNPAEDVVATLDQLGVARAAFVGASFGGRVTQEIAARWPDRVSAAALICAATRDYPPTAAIEAFGNREEELLEAGDVDAAVELNVATFLGPQADEDTRAAIAAMQRHAFEVQLAAPDVGPRHVDYDLAAITAPTLVVSGGHDVDFFQGIADMLAATIAGAERIHFDWAGHLPTVEDPRRATPIVVDWLARTR